MKSTIIIILITLLTACSDPSTQPHTPGATDEILGADEQTPGAATPTSATRVHKYTATPDRERYTTDNGLIICYPLNALIITDGETATGHIDTATGRYPITGETTEHGTIAHWQQGYQTGELSTYSQRYQLRGIDNTTECEGDLE